MVMSDFEYRLNHRGTCVEKNNIVGGVCTSKEKYYFPSELRTSQTMLYTQTPVIELNKMAASYSLIFTFPSLCQ